MIIFITPNLIERGENLELTLNISEINLWFEINFEIYQIEAADL